MSELELIDTTRRALGTVGILLPVTLDVPAPIDSQREAVRALEDAGYRSAWTNELMGKDALVQLALLLGATEHMTFGTGIANIWIREPQTLHAAASLLAQGYPDRFVLGMGVGYPQQAEYLRRMEGPTWVPVPQATYPRIVAANGPGMLALAAEVADGAFPAGQNPDFTGQARDLLGPDRLLVVGVSITLDDGRQASPTSVVEAVRAHLAAGADRQDRHDHARQPCCDRIHRAPRYHRAGAGRCVRGAGRLADLAHRATCPMPSLPLDLDEQYPGIDRRRGEGQKDRPEHPVEASPGPGGQADPSDDQPDARDQQRGQVLDLPRRLFPWRLLPVDHPGGLHGHDGARDRDLGTKGTVSLTRCQRQPGDHQCTHQETEGPSCSARQLRELQDLLEVDRDRDEQQSGQRRRRPDRAEEEVMPSQGAVGGHGTFWHRSETDQVVAHTPTRAGG